MSNARPWMPLYVDDYFRDTVHLDAEEHGIYLVLLMIAWRSNSGSLPGGMKELRRLVESRVSGLHGNRFNRLVPPILGRYFHQLPEGDFAQKRLGKELEKVGKRSGTARENARKRWADSSNIIDLADANAYATHTHTQTHKEKERKKERKTHKEKERKQTLAQLALSDGEFEQFWMLYPRHVGRPKAEQALTKVRNGGVDLETILHGLRRLLPSWTDPQYIPHPTTWLNRAGWDDDPRPSNGGNGNGRRNGQSAGDYARELAREIRDEELARGADGALDLVGGCGDRR